jgi:hypothetical protein
MRTGRSTEEAQTGWAASLASLVARLILSGSRPESGNWPNAWLGGWLR